MSLTNFTGDTSVISGLPDEPSLTSAQLKAKFDEAGTAIKTFINGTHNPEIEQLVATEKATLQTAISNLSTSVNNSISELNATENAMMSDNYSNMKSYKVGDLCIYNNVLYKCISEITVGESWNSSHWEQTTLGKAIRQSEIYSTDETDTGKIWIDGKKIYRKVIETTVGTLQSLVNNLDFDTIIDIKGWARADYDNKWIIPSHSQASGNYNIDIYFDIVSGKLRFVFGAYFGNERPVTLILEYTKTTD